MTNQELEDRLDRHETVIEKLIDKIAALETANVIQNFVNETNSKSTKEDISDTTIRT